MKPSEIIVVTNYHAHIYYDEETRARAATLRKAIESEFDFRMGRWREEPVGPHPQAMYQVAFDPNHFGNFVQWLLSNRNNLNILVHPNTGYSKKDHTTHAIWLGNPLVLDLEALESEDNSSQPQ